MECKPLYMYFRNDTIAYALTPTGRPFQFTPTPVKLTSGTLFKIVEIKGLGIEDNTIYNLTTA